MNASQVIQQIREDASEWIEMSNNPDALVSGILANKIVALESYIEYLERRLKNVCINK